MPVGFRKGGRVQLIAQDNDYIGGRFDSRGRPCQCHSGLERSALKEAYVKVPAPKFIIKMLWTQEVKAMVSPASG